MAQHPPFRFSLFDLFVSAIIIVLIGMMVLILMKGTTDCGGHHARVQGLMRKLNAACEVYRVDYLTYPVANNSTELHAKLGTDPRWVIQQYGTQVSRHP
jgi:hypothetical protein